MRRWVWSHVVIAVVLAAITFGLACAKGAGPDMPASAITAEARALAYLGREVPRWSRENHCFSCHNNGDAARALLEATRRKIVVAPGALDDTVAWLARPERWDANGVDAPFSDKRLARLQFAAALAAAVAAGKVADRPALGVAALRLADDQAEDGSWPVDEGALIGSPATYGRPLATAVARHVLARAGAVRFAAAIARADRWLRRLPVRNVLDASAVLLALGECGQDDDPLRRKCHTLLREAEARDGGWGPYRNSPPEAFDTAIALLALAPSRARADLERLVRRGRASLIAAQNEDGSWPETTRPPGGESYAQRLSTSGWATLALLATSR